MVDIHFFALMNALYDYFVLYLTLSEWKRDHRCGDGLFFHIL